MNYASDYSVKKLNNKNSRIFFNTNYSAFYFKNYKYNLFVFDQNGSIADLSSIKNPYSFLKSNFGIYNSYIEERLKTKFTRALIERSVDFFSLKKFSYLYRKNYSKNNYFLEKKNYIFQKIINNFLFLKKDYLINFIIYLKKFLFKLSKFDIENLNFFSRKKILTYCLIYSANYIYNSTNFYYFSLLLQKNFFDLSFLNYSNFFIDSKKNNKLWYFLSNKKSIKYFFSNNIYNDKNFNNILFIRIFKNLFKKQLNVNSIKSFDILKKNNFFPFFITKSFFFYEKLKYFNLINFNNSNNNENFLIKLKNFNQKINFLRNNSLTFFENFNFHLYEFYNKFNYYKFIYNDYDKYLTKFNNIMNFNNFSNQKIKFIFSSNKNSNFLFKKYINLKYIIRKIEKKFIKKYNFFISDIFFSQNKNIFYFFKKIENIDNFFFYNEVNINSFYFNKIFYINKKIYNFLNKNKNLLFENLNKEKMNHKTYYKRYFLKEKYKDTLSFYLVFSKYKTIAKSYFPKSAKTFDLIKYFFDFYFIQKFKINFKFKDEFFKKTDFLKYLSKFLKNFVFFSFYKNRVSLNQYVLYFHLFQNISKSFFSSSHRLNLFNSFKLNSFKYKKRLKKKIKNIFKLFNFLNLKDNSFLHFIDSQRLPLKKLFFNKFLNLKLNNQLLFYNYKINLQQKLLNYSKTNTAAVTKHINKFFGFFSSKSKFLKIKAVDLLSNLFLLNKKIDNKFFWIVKNFNLRFLFNNPLFFYYLHDNVNLNLTINYKFFINKFLLLKKIYQLGSDSNFFKNFNLLLKDNNYFFNRFNNLFKRFFNSFFEKFNSSINFFDSSFLYNKSFTIKNDLQRTHYQTQYKKIKYYYFYYRNLYKIYTKIDSFFKYSLDFIIEKFYYLNNLKYKLNYDPKKFNLKKQRKILNFFHKENFYIPSVEKLTYKIILFSWFKNLFFKMFIFPSFSFINYFKFLFEKINFSFDFNSNFFGISRNNFLKNYLVSFITKMKSIKRKNNLLWLDINITKRNVYLNLFFNKKKPSIFVYTAGQTPYEGKLKKSKEASILMGKKLWKKIVFFSRKFFATKDFFEFNRIVDFFQFYKRFKIKDKLNSKILDNNDKFFNSLKFFLFNYKKVLGKKNIFKLKIKNFLNKSSIAFLFKKILCVRPNLNPFRFSGIYYKRRRLKIALLNNIFNAKNKVFFYRFVHLNILKKELNKIQIIDKIINNKFSILWNKTKVYSGKKKRFIKKRQLKKKGRFKKNKIKFKTYRFFLKKKIFRLKIFKLKRFKMKNKKFKNLLQELKKIKKNYYFIKLRKQKKKFKKLIKKQYYFLIKKQYYLLNLKKLIMQLRNKNYLFRLIMLKKLIMQLRNKTYLLKFFEIHLPYKMKTINVKKNLSNSIFFLFNYFNQINLKKLIIQNKKFYNVYFLHFLFFKNFLFYKKLRNKKIQNKKLYVKFFIFFNKSKLKKISNYIPTFTRFKYHNKSFLNFFQNFHISVKKIKNDLLDHLGNQSKAYISDAFFSSFGSFVFNKKVTSGYSFINILNSIKFCNLKKTNNFLFNLKYFNQFVYLFKKNKKFKKIKNSKNNLFISKFKNFIVQISILMKSLLFKIISRKNFLKNYPIIISTSISKLFKMFYKFNVVHSRILYFLKNTITLKNYTLALQKETIIYIFKKIYRTIRLFIKGKSIFKIFVFQFKSKILKTKAFKSNIRKRMLYFKFKLKIRKRKIYFKLRSKIHRRKTYFKYIKNFRKVKNILYLIKNKVDLKRLKYFKIIRYFKIIDLFRLRKRNKIKFKNHKFFIKIKKIYDFLNFRKHLKLFFYLNDNFIKKEFRFKNKIVNLIISRNYYTLNFSKNLKFILQQNKFITFFFKELKFFFKRNMVKNYLNEKINFQRITKINKLFYLSKNQFSIEKNFNFITVNYISLSKFSLKNNFFFILFYFFKVLLKNRINNDIYKISDTFVQYDFYKKDTFILKNFKNIFDLPKLSLLFKAHDYSPSFSKYFYLKKMQLNKNKIKLNNLDLHLNRKFFSNIKRFDSKNLKSYKLSLNLILLLKFYNQYSIKFLNFQLFKNQINKFLNIKKKKNFIKRWRRKYYNKKDFDENFFVPKKGFLIITVEKRNRVVRGIYKGFMNQARGRRLFKRLRPKFVKNKKFIFTARRKPKGRRK